MYHITKLSGSDIWSMVPAISAEELEAREAETEKLRASVIDAIARSASTLSISIEWEDGMEKGNINDLERAIDFASFDELETLIKTGCIPYDGGYMTVSGVKWDDPSDSSDFSAETGEKKMALCEGRHSIPEAVDGSVFPSIVNPIDLERMRQTAAEKLRGISRLDLYVTGLTVALVEVINFCRENSVTLTLWHYNRETGEYYKQEVVG